MVYQLINNGVSFLCFTINLAQNKELANYTRNALLGHILKAGNSRIIIEKIKSLNARISLC